MPQLLFVLLFGCGADADAPSPQNEPAPATCPPLAELAPQTFALVEARQLPNLQRLLGETLEKQHVSALVDGVVRILRDLTAADLDQLFALTRDPRLTGLGDTVVGLLRFINTDRAGYRDALLTEASWLLRTCDGETLFTGVDALLDSPDLPRVLDSLGEVLALPIVQEVLSADLGGALDRDGFSALVCNIAAGLTQPGFSVDRDIIQPLSGIDILPVGEPPISTFLLDLDGMLDPNRPTLPAVADLVCCDLYGVSRCADVPANAGVRPGDPVFVWAIYDLFVGAGIDFIGLIEQFGPLLADEQLTAQLAPLRTVLTRLAQDPDLRDALVQVLAVALRPEIAAGVLPELERLIAAGAVGELLALVDALRKGCEVE